MQTSVKVEIIISTLELNEVLDILSTLRVSGYTVMKDAWGKGERGTDYNDLWQGSGNSYIMTICKNEQQVNYLLDELLPILKRIGGIFLLTNSTFVHY